jgi:DNA-damage-inducible protein D
LNVVKGKYNRTEKNEFYPLKKKQMEDQLSNPNQTVFEKIKRFDENKNEYWTARDLSIALEYSEYRHFKPAIDRAKEACKNSGYAVSDHFEDILDMIEVGKGAKRQIDNVKLSRYACYLIVQNADPSKEIVALGQTYFATQTRLQEIQQMQAYQQLKTEEEKRIFLRKEMSEHNRHLAEAAKGAGVIEPVDYAIFQNHGYMGLYGGLDAKGIHQRKRLKKSENILDHMGSTELAANLFRATQTEEKLKRENIKGKQKANQTHFEVGKKVRKTIQEIGGTMPENLPVADSIKKLDKKDEPKNVTTKKKKN